MRSNGKGNEGTYGISSQILPAEKLLELMQSEDDGQTMEEFLGPKEVAKLTGRKNKRWSFRGGPHRP